MNFEATPDQRAAAATYRAIALRHFAPSPRRGFDWATWRALSEAGLWRTLVAGRDAGADASLNVFIAAFEAIVAATRSVGFAMALANQATVIRALLLHGTPAQRDRFLPALPIGDMTFDGVPVGTDDLLCTPKDGLRVLMDIASMNRALFGLLCADVVGPFLDDALAYVGERGALGVTLDKHQHVQRRLVDIHVGAERSRWMALAALDQLRAGD
uniref:Acyl-CoA dehydrogenase n=2 Tax=Medicago truncatula TaxID=3880 RepID=A0A0D9SGL8_MEDTR